MCWFKVKNLAIAAFIIIGSIVAAGSSYAATLSPGSTQSDALGVNNLSVTFNGTTYTYNVTFENIAYDILYNCNGQNVCSSPPTFNGKEGLAEAVAVALANALNSFHVTGISGISPNGQQPYANIIIPFVLNADGTETAAWDHFCSSAYDACDDAPIPSNTWAATWSGPLTNDTNGGNPLGGDEDFTLFTLASTPLPAALPLFATGLGGLGLLGLRRKRKARAVA
jgi:hypothetical protein